MDDNYLNARLSELIGGTNINFDLKLIPDFCTDLNIMHKAEMWLKTQPENKYSKSNYHLYCRRLWESFGPCATAEQRAILMIEVLKDQTG